MRRCSRSMRDASTCTKNRLWKFSGLAHLGRARYERAQRLAEFCPRACGFSNGFLMTEWVDGKPATLTNELLDTMARYLAFLRAEFATERSPCLEQRWSR